MRFEPTTDALSTPVAWADAAGLIRGVNPAFARWLGVSTRRLIGQPLAALEIEGDAMARFLDNTDRDVLRLHRMALGMPGEPPCFAEGWLSRLEGGGYLLGDNNFDTNDLFDFTAEHNHRLIAPRRPSFQKKSLAHRYQSPHRKRCIEMLEPGPGRPCRFGRALAADRRQIERDFGNATSFGGGLTLPPFVRRAHRVRHWVHAKLLINAARIRYNRRQQAEAIAA